ncbi:MAG: ArsR family transcriptional regulator [Candidatus Thermoplasmatota archaeon]|nr:ArsR family transcriptional regulator [Candidatus Thermoplasmatota archaeon]
MKNNKSEKNIYELFESSDLPKTSSNILATIAKGRKLLVSEITRRVKRSERAVRHHLSILMKKGFLSRKIDITRNKKLAYRYSLKPLGEIVKKLKQELVIKIHKLNKFIQGF